MRHGGPKFLTAFLSLVHRVWREGRVPQAWCDAELIPIPKKGDLSLCDNWRGIALLDVVRKVVGRLIQNRLQHLAELELPESQCGFWNGRSCTDQIFAVSQVIEKIHEHHDIGFLVFIDLRKAYDSVSRPALWRALATLGVPPLLIQLISSFHDSMSAQVRVGDGHTQRIPVMNGLRQGCSMAPVLFNLFFALVLEKWNAEMAQAFPNHGVAFHFNVNGNLYNRPRTVHRTSSTTDLEFADDVVLITPTHSLAQASLSMFASVAASVGLYVNFTETKLMGCGVGLSDVDRQPLSIGSHTVGYIDSFVYLGSLLSSDTSVSADIDRRLASASRAFGALQYVFRDGNLSVRTKRLVYSACVMSTLLYGAECWATLRRLSINEQCSSGSSITLHLADEAQQGQNSCPRFEFC